MPLNHLLQQTIHLLFLPITLAVTVIKRLLPFRLILRLTLLRDIFISTSTLIIGRLLPALTVPPTNLTSKTAIITGANSGIGLQLATDLASSGATVYLACRSLAKAQTAITTIHWRVPSSIARIRAIQLDTSSFESTRAFAETWASVGRRIDILCHNAGIAAAPSAQDLNADGVEIVYATNLLGSFVLTHFLEPFLTEDARVVFTSGTGQYSGGRFGRFAEGPVRGVVEPGFHCPMVGRVPVLGWKVSGESVEGRYSMTKAMQCAFARCLQKKWDGEASEKGVERGRTAHAFTPGYTMTPIFGKFEVSNWWRDMVFVLLKASLALAADVDQGAATGTWLASTQNEAVVGWGKGGGYWDRMMRRVSAADLFSDELLERLWQRWENDAGITWR